MKVLRTVLILAFCQTYDKNPIRSQKNIGGYYTKNRYNVLFNRQTVYNFNMSIWKA